MYFLLLLLFLQPVSAETFNTQVVFIGDSITAGGLGVSYVDKLPDFGEPWNEVQLINSAVTGYSVHHYYQNSERIENHIIQHLPENVFIMLGIADLHDLDSQKYYKEYSWLVESILNQSSAKIFLLSLTYAGLGAAASFSLDSYQEVILNISKEYDLEYIDVYNCTELKFEYLVDTVHLSDLGAEVVANEIVTHSELLISLEELNTNDALFQTFFYLILIFPVFRKIRKKQE